MISGMASIAISFAAFTLLALAMEKHAFQMLPEGAKGKDILLKTAGWAGLVLSVLPCFFGWEGGLAWIAWLGCVSISGGILVMLLAYVPQSIPKTAKATGAIGVLLLLVSILT